MDFVTLLKIPASGESLLRMCRLQLRAQGVQVQVRDGQLDAVM